MKHLRRKLRQKSTKPEQLLWQILRSRRLQEWKFRRQHSIGNYIVDFACIEDKVVIEIDGGYHDYVFEKDQERQQRLEKEGWRVLRFSNEDVLHDPEAVGITIARMLKTPSPRPSPPELSW